MAGDEPSSVEPSVPLSAVPDSEHPFRAPESFAPPPVPSAPAPPRSPTPANLLPPPLPQSLVFAAVPNPANDRSIRWGLGQVWLGLGVALGLNFLVSIVGLVVWFAFNLDSLSSGDITGATQQILDDLTTSPVFLMVSLLTLWAGFLLGVFVASYRRGQHSLKLDFGWRIVWRTDILWGIGLAVVLRLADAGFSWLLQTIGVNSSAVDNSAPIVNQQGIALIVVGLAAAFGAPIVEELFFRGLTLRALQKRWGPVVAVIGSSVLFGLLHAQPDKSGALGFSSLWLVSFVTVLGAVLAIVAIKTKRLGVTVTAHIAFNASALILAVFVK